MKGFNFSGRSSGILLHVTSLPGKDGSGDLGKEAFNFIYLLEKAGQSWWQMLPVGPPGFDPAFSPYDSCSGFAGSPWLVSLKLLASEGLLKKDYSKLRQGFSGYRVNFSEVHRYREVSLRSAFDSFIRLGNQNQRTFIDFCTQNYFWLKDYSLFMALKNHSGGKPWTSWNEDLRTRRPEALTEARIRLSDEIAYHQFVQFKFENQWRAMHDYSTARGIGLIGDLPIFVSHDSADVWSHQELFQLNPKGKPLKVSGYPPDRFNLNGQRWGHPQYKWTEHLKSDFYWWVQRFSRMYSLFDAVRIDHFLGFNRTWSIPARSSGAGTGSWVRSPGFRLFSAVEKKLGQKPMIAEDLGHVTPADVKLRKEFNMLPTRIFQFGFGNEEDSARHMPHNYNSITAAYTGNHDNNTFKGWFSKLSLAKKRLVMAYCGGQPHTIHWDGMRTLQCSVANLVIFPLQDILGLGSGSRMNVPGSDKGNWNWRVHSGIPEATVKRLGCQTRLAGRR